MSKIIVIGGGFGGLAAAGLLAKAGHRVTLLEKNEQLGGRASVLEEAGFRFDMGPSWYMMPEVFERWFEETGFDRKAFYDLTPLTPQYRVFFDDHSFLEITGDIERDAALFESIEPGAGQQLHRYLKEGKEKYDLAMQEILYRNADSLWGMLTPKLFNPALALKMLQPLHRYVAQFFKHPRLQQLIEYNLVFLGCSPYNAPALFSLMAYADMGLGVYYPTRGMGTVVAAMRQVCEQLGVDIRLQEPARKLVTRGKQIEVVQTDVANYEADFVVGAAEYPHIESLIDDPDKRDHTPAFWAKKQFTPSAFLLYLGVKGKLPELLHHTLYFGEDWRVHFREIFDEPAWPMTPSLYINKTSATDPTVAPEGHENLMVLVPVAAGLPESVEWKAEYQAHIMDFIDRKLGTNLKRDTVYAKVFSISDFASRYNAWQGNALGGLAHTLFQSAVFRPGNRSRKLDNLFLAGASTVPGIGVPTSIISGHLVADRVAQLTDKKS